MKRVGKEPRLLPNVMEAIASLKERHGSTPKQIVEHIVHILKKNKDASRNVTVQVRRALEHGLHCGLIKQRSGKFTLGLDRRDYAIFRRFRQFNDPTSDCNSCRRGRRRGRRGKRGRRRSRRRGRRGRKRTLSNEDALSDDTESGQSVTAGTPEPMDKGRRRRRRRRGRRRRSKRGRRHRIPHEANSDSSVTARKESNTAIPPEKKRSQQEKVDYQQKSGSNHNHHQERHQERSHQDRNHEQEEEDVEDCGNPECLCNIKQEEDSPRCMSRENNYYNESYLN